MFTRNWHKLVAAAMYRCKEDMTFQSVTNKTAGLAWNYATNLIQFGYNNNGTQYPSIHYLRTGLNQSGGAVIGTGTTPPTINDYCLAGDVITKFSYSSSVSATEDEHGITATALYTITNTGDEAFTIGEIGLVASCEANYATMPYESSKALLERTVLETPITIEPGGVGQVTYTIRMNYPTA